jgi:preprotein translocase subunit Sec63
MKTNKSNPQDDEEFVKGIRNIPLKIKNYYSRHDDSLTPEDFLQKLKIKGEYKRLFLKSDTEERFVKYATLMINNKKYFAAIESN